MRGAGPAMLFANSLRRGGCCRARAPIHEGRECAVEAEVLRIASVYAGDEWGDEIIENFFAEFAANEIGDGFFRGRRLGAKERSGTMR